MRWTPSLAALCVPVSLVFLSACGSMSSAPAPKTLRVPHHPYGIVAARAPVIPVLGGAAALSVVSPTVVAAILNGQLAVTSNGGKSWPTHSLPKKSWPAALDFVSRSTGFLIAWTGQSEGRPTVFKTTDGGRHWHKQFSAPPSSEGFPQIDMVSAQNGWAVLSNTLYRTVDGGLRWTSVHLQPGTPARLDFINATHGWVAMQGQNPAHASLLETTDGVHFKTILTSPNGIGAITLASPTTGDVLEGAPGGSMAFGPVLKTTDAGRHWSTRTSTAAFSQSHAFGYAGGMAFYGKTGWIGTNNGAQGFQPLGLLATANGGASWHPTQQKFGWAIQALAMTGPGTGWIVAGQPDSQFLAHTQDNGRRWTIAWPPASPNTIDFVTPARGFGTGLPSNSEAIVQTRSGGAHWTLAQAAPPRPFTASAFSPSLGLAVYSTFISSGAQSILYQSKDGGSRWTVKKVFPGIQLDSVQSLGHDTWTVTVQDNLNITTHVWISRDNGAHWTPLKIAVRAGTMIDAVSPHAWWVVTNPKQERPDHPIRVLLEDARGQAERTVLSLPSFGPVRDYVGAISFCNTRDGWVWVNEYIRSPKMIKKPGAKHRVHAAPSTVTLLYYTTDGGVHWTKWQLPADWSTSNLQLVTPTVGFMDMSGVILKTTDGGGSWTEVQ